MIAEKRVANAVGGKTARACDGCIKKRARWYCAADDAFLCQGCDASVHSANPLANRHERVRLKTSSFKSMKPSCLDSSIKNNQVPSWQRGVIRKARTPRPGNKQSNSSKPDDARRNPFSLVPEFGVEELVFDENEEQLLYRVPVFDPLMGELSTSTNSNDGGEISNNNSISTTLVVLKDDGHSGEAEDCNGCESKDVMLSAYDQQEVDDLKGFLSSEMDLADFAADVESLLGKSLDNGTFGIEELGLMECKEKDSNTDSCCLGNNGWVKLEVADTGDVDNKDTVACHFDMEFDMTREQFELSFDYESPATCEDEEEKVLATVGDGVVGAHQNDGEVIEEDGARKKRRKLLSLNYEAVISAWASQGSPWTAGIRPNFDPEDCWPNCMGTCGIESHNPYAEMGGLVGGHSTVISDGGREARVSRYREKRRTRLFSKKIRYEVRKLNAEKRPRMKGRFVKRASLTAGASFPPAVLSK